MGKACTIKIPKRPRGGACDETEACEGAELSLRVVGASVAAAGTGTITIRPSEDMIITGLYLSGSASNYTSACTTDAWRHNGKDMYQYVGASGLTTDVVETQDLIDFTHDNLRHANPINLLEPQFRHIGPNTPIEIDWTNGTGGAIVPKLVVLCRYPEADEVL